MLCILLIVSNSFLIISSGTDMSWVTPYFASLSLHAFRSPQMSFSCWMLSLFSVMSNPRLLTYCCILDIQVVLGRPRFLFDGLMVFCLGLLDLVALGDQSRNGGVFLLSYSMVLLSYKECNLIWLHIWVILQADLYWLVFLCMKYSFQIFTNTQETFRGVSVIIVNIHRCCYFNDNQYPPPLYPTPPFFTHTRTTNIFI